MGGYHSEAQGEGEKGGVSRRDETGDSQTSPPSADSNSRLHGEDTSHRHNK